MSQQAHPSERGVRPVATRPVMPAGYGIPTADSGMLPWRWVDEPLTAARTYWVDTTRPDGRPPVAPVWGV